MDIPPPYYQSCNSGKLAESRHTSLYVSGTNNILSDFEKVCSVTSHSGAISRRDCVLSRPVDAVQAGYCPSQSGVGEWIDSLTWFNRDLGKGPGTNWKSLKRNRLWIHYEHTLLTLHLPNCIPTPPQQYARKETAPCGLGSNLPSIS